MPHDASSDPAEKRDRQAIEYILGRSLPVEPWPESALPAGTHVRVTRDPQHGGPWANEFLGVISPMGIPEPVRHACAHPDELAYWVTFDEPQFDSQGDGPYRKAQVWGRYLHVARSDALTNEPQDDAAPER